MQDDIRYCFFLAKLSFAFDCALSTKPFANTRQARVIAPKTSYFSRRSRSLGLWEVVPKARNIRINKRLQRL